MKKIFLLLLLIQLFVVGSGAAAFAEEEDGAVIPAPGCNPQMEEMLRNQAEAIRIRDNAYEQELIKRNDPAAGITCFDQQLKMTAKLGKMFSDKEISYDASTGALFCGLLGTDVSGTLSTQLGSVIEDTLGKMLNNFLGSISLDMFSDITSTLGFLKDLNYRVCMPKITLPTVSVPKVRTGNDIFDKLIACVVPAGKSPTFGGQSFGGQCQDLGIEIPSIDCNRIAELWSSVDPTKGALSIQGGGSAQSTPYASLEDILKGGASVSGLGEDFLKALSNDNSLLSKALSDLTTLKKPGGVKSWPAPPSFSREATTAEIIRGM